MYSNIDRAYSETWKKEVIALEISKVILLDFCSVAASITLFSL